MWDKLDAWHSRLMLLENEVEDLAEDHPDQAHILVDQLTRPLQLYQNAAQMAEQRTAFLGKVGNSGIRTWGQLLSKPLFLWSLISFSHARSPAVFRSLTVYCTVPPAGWRRHSHGSVPPAASQQPETCRTTQTPFRSRTITHTHTPN